MIATVYNYCLDWEFEFNIYLVNFSLITEYDISH
jgi:hypothetical protein